MSKKIIKMPSLKEQVYSYLRNAIITEEIEVEKTYSEQWFADLLEVSRTPVREALLQLKQENLLDILPYKGVVVKALSSEEITEIFQIRQSIEGYCVTLIAEDLENPLAKNLLTQLGENICEQRELVNQIDKIKVDEFVELDKLFHNEIINYANNDRFADIYTNVRSRVERISVKTLKKEGRLKEGYQEHVAIYEKMVAGQPWEAYLAVKDHLDNAKMIMESENK
jgi:DNA-binding GntR family transcriptional regulator